MFKKKKFFSANFKKDYFFFQMLQRSATSEQWVKACAFNPCECEARVDDLAENGVYEFRVRAVNRAGESEASASSGAFKVSEYPHGVKAEFTRRLVDCEGASGKDASFSVEFEGRHGVFFRGVCYRFQAYDTFCGRVL